MNISQQILPAMRKRNIETSHNKTILFVLSTLLLFLSQVYADTDGWWTPAYPFERAQYETKEAADICRGNNDLVNAAMSTGLAAAWWTGLQDSQSTVLNNIRDILIWEDIARRQEGATDANQCVCGNDVDRYHEFAFDFSGISPFFYGGSRFPIQDFGPNPVPLDPRNSSDPRNWFR